MACGLAAWRLGPDYRRQELLLIGAIAIDIVYCIYRDREVGAQREGGGFCCLLKKIWNLFVCSST